MSVAMSVIDSIRKQLAPIHPEGYPFVGGFAFASLVLFWLWTPLGWLATLLTLWCAYFFRDPPRVTPLRDGIVVAPRELAEMALAKAWEKAVGENKVRDELAKGRSVREVFAEYGIL